MIGATYLVLGLASVLFVVRLLAGPSLADRVLSLDGLVVCAITTLVTRAVDTGDGSFLPVAVVLTLVGFVSTSVIARFIEGQGE